MNTARMDLFFSSSPQNSEMGKNTWAKIEMLLKEIHYQEQRNSLSCYTQDDHLNIYALSNWLYAYPRSESPRNRGQLTIRQHRIRVGPLPASAFC